MGKFFYSNQKSHKNKLSFSLSTNETEFIQFKTFPQKTPSTGCFTGEFYQ